MPDQLIGIGNALGAFAGGKGDIQIKRGNTQITKFTRDHPGRTSKRGFFWMRQGFILALCRTGTQHAKMHIAGQILTTNRLSKEKQAVKPLLLHPMEKARPGAETFITGDHPAMDDPVGDQITGIQIRNQRIIAFAPAFRGDDIGHVTGTGECVAGGDGDNLMACGTQTICHTIAKARIIKENQPCLRRGL